jgi:hypothetical protein
MSKNVKFDTYAACEVLAKTLRNHIDEKSAPFLIMAFKDRESLNSMAAFHGSGTHELAFLHILVKQILGRLDEGGIFRRNAVRLLEQVLETAANDYYGGK